MRKRKTGLMVLALFLVTVITATTTRAATAAFAPAGSAVPDVFRYADDKEEELKEKKDEAERAQEEAGQPEV